MDEIEKYFDDRVKILDELDVDVKISVIKIDSSL
jgi:hypothetical protein